MATKRPTASEYAKHLIERAAKRPGSIATEERNREAFDLARRRAAQTILHPHEVSGEYDAGRTLLTKRGGELRPITTEDIKAFQQNVHNLKKKYIGGITPQSVIDLSMPGDRDRANKQIHMAVPAAVRGRMFKFITNAGPDSKVARHIVNVEFLDFDAAVAASPNNRKATGKQVAKGRIRFECNCERFTFMFRYIATVGRYVLGRSETGFPKITNHGLEGVSCKHGLRVMHVILKDSGVHGKIADQVAKAREVLDQRELKVEKIKAADLREHAHAQAGKSTKSRALKTSVVRKAESAARRLREKMARDAAGVKPKNPSPAQIAKTQRQAAVGLQAALKLGAITQAQYDAAMANIGAMK